MTYPTKTCIRELHKTREKTIPNEQRGRARSPLIHTPYHKCSPTNILKIYTHKIIKPRLSRSSVICISSFSWSALSSSILLFLWSTYLYYTGCLESFLLLVSKDVGGSTSLNPIAFWLFWSILRLYENLPCRTSF